MPLPRERQIFLALCALDEIADQARHSAIQPSFALRFILAFLWSCSDGRDRTNYDAVWRNLVNYTPKPRHAGPAGEQAQRHAFARNQFNGIVRSLGFDVEAMQTRINRARGRPDGYRPVVKLWGSMTEREKLEHARTARHCDLIRTDQPFPKLRL